MQVELWLVFVEISPLALQENVNACFIEEVRNRYLDFGSGSVSVLVIFLGCTTFGECQLNVSLWTKQVTHQHWTTMLGKYRFRFPYLGF